MRAIRHGLMWAAAYCCGCIALLSGCGGDGLVDDSPVIVTFKDNKLTGRMLSHYVPEGVSPKDSARYADQYIQQWIREQAIMDRALDEDKKLAERVDFKVKDYRAKLIMHEYHTRLIEDSLDQHVPQEEIKAYYEQHKENFRSKESLYSYLYVVSTQRDLREPSEWMRSENLKDIRKLQEWAAVNALEYQLDSSYVGESRIKQVSKGYFGNLQKAQIGKFIRWNGVIQGERRRYMFKMLDVVAESAPLPLRLCRDKIHNLILNERKISLIERTEDKILKNARANNHIREE